jgi:multiple sugar transport system permease protein
MIMGFWGSMGGTSMILYLAGLQGISPQLYEAAEIDGANAWHKFRYITFPMLSPTTFFIFITSVIGGFQGGFQAAYVMTKGGPNGATSTISYYIYNHAFQWFNMGYAAAISVVLFAMVFVVTMINWRFGGRKVNYT